MTDVFRSRVRRSRKQWQQLIDEQEKSDQTQVAFCQTHGVAASSFQYWKRKLRRAEPDIAPEWVELPVDLSGSTSGWDIELSLGEGLVLRLRRR